MRLQIRIWAMILATGFAALLMACIQWEDSDRVSALIMTGSICGSAYGRHNGNRGILSGGLGALLLSVIHLVIAGASGNGLFGAPMETIPLVLEIGFLIPFAFLYGCFTCTIFWIARMDFAPLFTLRWPKPSRWRTVWDLLREVREKYRQQFYSPAPSTKKTEGD